MEGEEEGGMKRGKWNRKGKRERQWEEKGEGERQCEREGRKGEMMV